MIDLKYNLKKPLSFTKPQEMKNSKAEKKVRGYMDS
jgi:hypothetical protein